MSELPKIISTSLETVFSDVPIGYKALSAILIAMLIYSFRFIFSETGIGLIKSTVRTRNREIGKNLELISNSHIDSKSKAALRNRTSYLIRKGIIDVADEKLQDCLIKESKHKNIDLRALKGVDSYLEIYNGAYKLIKPLILLDSIFMFILLVGTSASFMGLTYTIISKRILLNLPTTFLLMVFLLMFIGSLYLFQKATYKMKISKQLDGETPRS